MKSWLDEIDVTEDLPIIIHCDNTAAISISENTGGTHSRVKHVDVKHHWIRETVELGEIAIEYIPSEDNIADLFTKSLARPQLEKLMGLMGM